MYLKKTRILLFTARLVTLAATGSASDWWLSTEMTYAKPFRSAGYSGQSSDGMGTQSRLEYRLQPWVTLGLGYSQTKIVQKMDSADFGFMDGSVRLLYPSEFGIEPYMMVGVGGGGTNKSTSDEIGRSAAASGQASLGIMLASADRPWAIDGGVGYHRSGSEDNGFNLVEGHVGLQIRYGGSKAAAVDTAKAQPKPVEAVAYKDGLKMLKDKDYSKAAQSFAAAVQADPNSSRAWHGLGNAVYMQSVGEKKQALHSWSKSLALNPKNVKLATFVSDLKEMTDSAGASSEERKQILKLYDLSMLPQQ